MRTLANIIWFIFGGLVTALGWAVLGVLLCITIIGIPLGNQCFKCATLTIAPFGKDVNLDFDSHPIGNTLWAIFVGWEFFCMYIGLGIVCMLSIICIPIALQIFKLAKLSFIPFGSKIKVLN